MVKKRQRLAWTKSRSPAHGRASAHASGRRSVSERLSLVYELELPRTWCEESVRPRGPTRKEGKRRSSAREGKFVGLDEIRWRGRRQKRHAMSAFQETRELV